MRVTCCVPECENQSREISIVLWVLTSLWARSTEWFVCKEHYDLFDEEDYRSERIRAISLELGRK